MPESSTNPAFPGSIDVDVIDRAAGLSPGQALFAARRFRAPVVQATQASHDAILMQPVAGLSVADRLRVAVHVCQASDADGLAQHYFELLKDTPDGALPHHPALEAMKHFAATLTTHPRNGDRAAIEALKAADLGDEAIVALAQLVSFLAYQTRVVAGLLAIKATAATKPGAQA